MKEFDIYFAECTGNSKNCVYPRKMTVRTGRDLSRAVSFDYVCAGYEGGRRSKQGFVSSDVAAMDCDNEKTENPDRWLTPEKIKERFPDVMFYVHYSRNNNKPKGGLSPRPRFHVLFPIVRTEDGAKYEMIKRQIASLIPEFDENAVDRARFFFGTRYPQVRCFNGSRLITDYLTAGTAARRADRDIYREDLSPIPQGERNSALYSSACSYLRRFDPVAAFDRFSEAADRCSPPLPDGEVQRIWRNALDFIQANPSAKRPKPRGDGGKTEPVREEKEDSLPVFVEVRGGKKRINEGLLTQYFRDNHRMLIVQHFNSVYYYLYDEEKGVYVRQSEVDLHRRIDEIITDCDPALLKHNLAKSVVGNLKAGKTVKESELNADESLINFENGLLNIDTMELTPHSPDVRSTRQIPCRWTKEPSPAPVFDLYMKSLTNGDEKVEKTLLQWLGLIFSSADGSRIKKSLLLYGKGNTGKSIFYKLVQKIAGEENCASIRLADFQERFGLSEMYGKRLIGDPEVDSGIIKNNTVIKSIIGGDPISIEQKGKDRFSTLYRGFAMFCGNELPRFGGDRGRHFFDRFIIIRCSNVVPEEKRDVYILDKMYAEREGIVHKALTAYRELRANSHIFDEPEHCRNEIQNFKRQNSPAAAFVKECCVPWERGDIKALDYSNRRVNVFKVFEQWEKENLLFPAQYTEPKFLSEIADYMGCTIEDLRIHKTDGNYYPFRLSNDIAAEYSTVRAFDYP